MLTATDAARADPARGDVGGDGTAQSVVVAAHDHGYAVAVGHGQDPRGDEGIELADADDVGGAGAEERLELPHRLSGIESVAERLPFAAEARRQVLAVVDEADHILYALLGEHRHGGFRSRVGAAPFGDAG